MFLFRMYKKANYKVYMFSKIRNVLQLMQPLWCISILPYLDYASFLLDSAYQYSLSLLDKIHNRCIRIMEYKRKGNRDKDIQNLMHTYWIKNIRFRRKI